MSDTTGIFTEHLKFSRSVIALPLPLFFTPIVRRGHMPQLIRYSTLVPIPKNDKVASVSANYRPIALSSMLSKVLERLLLNKYKYAEFFSSSHLQFGFKSGSSTTLCAGMVKNIVSRYIHSGSSVFGCFLDASRAFDLVDHNNIFSFVNLGLVASLPLVILRFLLSWYECLVRWGVVFFCLIWGFQWSSSRKHSLSFSFCAVFGWLVV